MKQDKNRISDDDNNRLNAVCLYIYKVPIESEVFHRDPCPGKPKQFVIQYISASGTLIKTVVPEHSTFFVEVSNHSVPGLKRNHAG